jgi:hypothetical protein
VQTVWGLCVGQSSQGQARSQPNSVGMGWSGEAGQSIVLAGVRGPGTVDQMEQVVSESAVVYEGGTADSPGRRTGARDGGVGGAGRARARRGRRRRVGLAGVCRTR